MFVGDLAERCRFGDEQHRCRFEEMLLRGQPGDAMTDRKFAQEAEFSQLVVVATGDPCGSGVSGDCGQGWHHATPSP